MSDDLGSVSTRHGGSRRFMSNHRSDFSNVPILSTMEHYQTRRFEQQNRSMRRSNSVLSMTLIDTSACALCFEHL